MSTIVKETGTSNFATVNAGTYQAVWSGVWDIGKQKQEYNGETKYPHQLIVRFELNKKITEGEYAGKRYTLNKFYTASLHEKAGLRKDLESWRGKPFTKEELTGFDVDTIIGANCLIGVIHTPKGKAKIASISPIMQGMEKMTPELDVLETPAWVQKFKDKQVIHEEQPVHTVDDMEEGVPF